MINPIIIIYTVGLLFFIAEIIIRKFLEQPESASYLNISFLIIIFWFLDKEYENFKTETKASAGAKKLIGLYVAITVYAFIMVNYVIFSLSENELFHLGFDIWANSLVMTFIILILFLQSDAKGTLRKSNLMILIWLLVNIFLHFVYNIYRGNLIRLTIDAILFLTRMIVLVAFYQDDPKSGKLQFYLIVLNVPLDIYLCTTSPDIHNTVIDGFIVSVHLLYLWILQKQYQIFCKIETRPNSPTEPLNQGLTKNELEEVIDNQKSHPGISEDPARDLDDSETRTNLSGSDGKGGVSTELDAEGANLEDIQHVKEELARALKEIQLLKKRLKDVEEEKGLSPLAQVMKQLEQDSMPAFDCIWVMYGLVIIDFIADFFARVIFGNQDLGLQLDISFLLLIFWFLDKEYESFKATTKTSMYWKQQLIIYLSLAIYTFVMVNYIIFSVLAKGDFSLLRFNFWDNAAVMTGILYIIFRRCKEDHELRRCNETILLWLFVNAALYLGYYSYLGIQIKIIICITLLIFQIVMFVGNRINYTIDQEKKMPLVETVQFLGLLINLVLDAVLFWINTQESDYRGIVIDASLWLIQLLYLYIFHSRTNYLRKLSKRVTEFGQRICRICYCRCCCLLCSESQGGLRDPLLPE